MGAAKASMADIRAILSEKSVAVAGLSRSGQAMSNSVLAELKARGYKTYAVNPNAERIGDDACYPSLSALAGKAGAVIVFTKPEVSESVVRDAAAAGIRKVWLQQGAESEGAIAAARAAGLTLVAGQCVLMHLEPVGALHGIHRFFARLFGSAPR
jgi:hypothetical protein